MAKLTQEQVLKALASMSDAERQELLHTAKESGIAITARAPKAEKEIVAYRVQLKDTAPNARRPRKAGDVFPMTEKSLVNTINTWVRGKKGEDVESLRQAKIASVLSGHKETFSAFEIVGATSPDAPKA